MPLSHRTRSITLSNPRFSSPFFLTIAQDRRRLSPLCWPSLSADLLIILRSPGLALLSDVSLSPSTFKKPPKLLPSPVSTPFRANPPLCQALPRCCRSSPSATDLILRALHEKEEKRMSRAKFFSIALICSFACYVIPDYLFWTLTSISWVCWVFSKSVTAQQLGSGMKGLGLGAFTLDWFAVSSFLFNPLVCPFYVIANVFIGYLVIIYIAIPTAYWGLNLYNAKNFPIFSSNLFTSQGQIYNITGIVNNKFQIDMAAYEQQRRINLSMFFALTYGFGFATIAAMLTHVACFCGRKTQRSSHLTFVHFLSCSSISPVSFMWS